MPKPKGVPERLVVQVPALGTTWIDRGPGYWLRRTLLTIFMTAVFLLLVGFIVAFLSGLISGVGLIGRGVIFTLPGIAIASGCWSGLRALRQKKLDVQAALSGSPDLQKLKRPSAKRASVLGVSGLGIGALARGGSAIAGAFLFVGTLFGLGWFLAIMLSTFGRYLNVEEARATHKVQAWRAQQADSHGKAN